jgi:hypothetical protein
VGERQLLSVEKKAAKVFDGLAYLEVGDVVVAAFVIGRVADDRVIYRG